MLEGLAGLGESVEDEIYGNEVPPPLANAVAAATRLRASEINEAEIAGRSRRRLLCDTWVLLSPTRPAAGWSRVHEELRSAGC